MSFFKKDNIKIFLVLSLILVAIVILFSISILCRLFILNSQPSYYRVSEKVEF